MPENTNGYVTIDVETTGCYTDDRIIEIAVVTLDHRLRRVDEYETLVDPERDLGPTHIHGITPSMVSMAPRFSDVAAALSERIGNKTLVAHNLSFESRMLAGEFERLGAGFDAGRGICTLQLTREKLPRACESWGITPPQHHRALADARATAELLRAVAPNSATSPIAVHNLRAELNLRTHRRCAEANCTVMDRLVSGTTYRDVNPELLEYIDLLDWVLDDLVITEDERKHLDYIADELNLSPAQVNQAQVNYFAGMLAGAEKDGVITTEEQKALTMVASALGIPLHQVPAVSDQNDASAPIPPGSALCFTGTCVDQEGNAFSKAQLRKMASQAGFEVVSNVTKSKCDVLVAVDPNSSSGKAKKARQFGKSIISAERFLSLLGDANCGDDAT